MERPVNFRDLGGITAQDGRSLQPLRLLRSGELYQLKPQDKERLVGEYRLAQIVDLRGEYELENAPDDEIDGVHYTNLNIMKALAHAAPSKENSQIRRNLEEVHSFMRSIYTDMVTNTTALQGFRDYLDILLAREDGAVLFHCFAGKDRTGVAAAFTLALLGVDKPSIMADYMRTNQLRAAHNQRLIEAAMEEGKDGEELEAMNAFLCVDESYLQGIYDIAESKSDGLEGFVRNSLDVAEAEVKRLKELYLSS